MGDLTHMDEVRRMLVDAKAIEPPAEEPAPAPPPDEEMKTEDRGGKRRPKVDQDGLPLSCPVIPLGVNGDVFYYLDASRQLRPLEGAKHSRLGVQSLFQVKIPLLYAFWPRYDKSGENVTGWRPEHAAERLMAACARNCSSRKRARVSLMKR